MHGNTVWHALRRTAALTACVSLILSGCGEETFDYTTNYGQGIRALESGDYQTAFTFFQSAINNDGQEAEGRRGQGIAQMGLGDMNQAITLFESAVKAVKYPAQNKDFIMDCEFYEGQACLDSEQYDKALTIYDSLLDGDRAGEAFLMRGRVYLNMEKYGQAAADFQHAVELDPSYEIYLQVYEAYVSCNRQADGAVFLKNALSIEPQSGEDNYQLGRICYELKDYDNAKQYLNKALDAGVQGAAVLLGKTCLDDGDVDGARTMYQRCIDKNLAVSAGYNGLAICDIQDGDVDAAQEHITEGLEASDTTMKEELMYNEIVVCEMKGDYDTASSKMAAFLSAYPSNETAIRENKFISGRVAEENAAAPEKVFDTGETES